MNSLPEGWTETSIGSVCEINPKHSSDLDDALQVSFVPMGSIDEIHGSIGDHSFRPLGEVKKGYTHFADGDVIFAKITPCMENGNCAVAENLNNGIACGSTEFFVFRPNGALEPKYLYRYLRQERFRQTARKAMTGAVGQARVPKQFMENTCLPLPPPNEQRRIVAKLDALFEKNRSIREKLDRLPRLLANLQKSILNSAFRGDLTKDWRANNPNVEPASELLKRIRAERRAKWEADLIAKGKDPKKAKYVEPEPVDVEGLPELPEGWCWTSVEEITFNFDGKRIPVKSDDRKKMAGPYPYYGASGVIDSVDQYIFDGNYLLIAEDGANLLSRSTPIAFAASGKFWVNNHAHVVQTAGGIPLEYLAAYLESIDLTPFVRGMAQPKLNQQQLNSIALPLPPLTEMKHLVQLISSLSDRVSFLADQTKKLSLRVTTFEASSLQKAFRGELVPQDPNDEPASVLLERIRAQKPAAGTKRGRGRKAAA